jgi:hypothetical protein
MDKVLTIKIQTSKETKKQPLINDKMCPVALMPIYAKDTIDK